MSNNMENSYLMPVSMPDGRLCPELMTEEELEESIQWEAEQYIPFDIKDVNIDFQILGPAEAQGQMSVLLVAAKKDMINDYVNALTECGLNPSVVDVAAFAVEHRIRGVVTEELFLCRIPLEFAPDEHRDEAEMARYERMVRCFNGRDRRPPRLHGVEKVAIVVA